MSTPERTPIVVGEHISRLVPYSPGKPIEEVKRELGLDRVIKLASNENSLGPSPAALRAIADASSHLHLYPDASSRDLRTAVSDQMGVAGDHLVFGNGSDEIIHMLGLAFLQPGDTLIQAEPTFVRYEASAILNQAACLKVPLSGWTHDLDAMAEQVDERTRLVYIANPNNPTGTIVTEEQVRRFVRRLPPRAVLVLDEAYFEYVTSDQFPDVIGLIRDGLNVIALRTFSKAYGLAGLRIGYGIARPDIIQSLEQVREPFNTSAVAQAAGAAALLDLAHLHSTRRMNEEGKSLLYAAFRRMGLDFEPTEANFVWVDLKRDTQPIFQGLLQQGVIVRCGSHVGSSTHLRVTIGTEEENQVFLEALEEVLASA